MKSNKVHLATSSAELKERAHAAYKESGGAIILVPVDFSDHSEAALLQAAEYANLMQTSLVILHVVHDPGEMPGYYSKLVKKKRATRMPDVAAEAFREFMADTIKANPELEALQQATQLMVIGLPVTRILEVVDHMEPLMVVMGSQGRTGLKHLVIGSKAAQVVQLCPVPVTIVKRRKAA
ncbi:MAG: universal stress protein [Gammaproteobacteria bacterium]|nr:universal stress protein [Gammaproteobacteria bacterium]MBT8111033.1 universal stress protein [Gammaproteobacteria bacterium]NND47504.1 universal stress protein [Woeseiaceae bacterium]NNL45731.1 universal stress protein [Woeseiaceae bacterium]